MKKLLLIALFLSSCNPFTGEQPEDRVHSVTLSFTVIDSAYHEEWAWLCIDSEPFHHPESVRDTLQLDVEGSIKLCHSYRFQQDTVGWSVLKETFWITSDTVINCIINCKNKE